MANKKDVEEWVREGTITQAQADKMLADTKVKKEKARTNSMVTTFSTIGAISLGIGAVLFVASNWDAMSNLLKIFILVGSTFLATFIGYYLKYVKKNLPVVGASLLFLGTLLFGATLFLVTQMYHINANNSTIVLVWLLGILPLIYGFKSRPIAALSIVLFLVWIGLVVEHQSDLFGMVVDVAYLPLLYLMSGMLLFGIGTVHYFSDSLKEIARMYRLAGLRLVAFVAFLFTFDWFIPSGGGDVSTYFTFFFLTVAVAALLLVVVGLFFNPAKSKTIVLESGFTIGLLGLGLLNFFFPISDGVYQILYNLVFVALIVALYYVGFHREDITVVNLAMGWTAIYFFARYFDFFYDLLDRSIFFIVGGLIFVMGGIALEYKRRDIKKDFIHHPQS
ncbi:MAG: hypothetical protein CMI52_00600 [Parcubacteria group bacterium]|nr:hypothetical protein [Parcubacteria group bacterium]